MLAGIAAVALAASPDQVPPVPSGQARVWFLRELVPGTAMHAPMIYANGEPLQVSYPCVLRRMPVNSGPLTARYFRLAKVGVGGSNPLARSSIELKAAEAAAFGILGAGGQARLGAG